MIKNATIFKIIGMPALDALPEFVPCMPSQAISTGFVPPNGNGLVEKVGGQIILKMMTETKKVPADVIDRKAKERALLVEQETGRKPGKKEMREIREEMLLDLLPTAFPSRLATLIWIDPNAMTMVVDTASTKRGMDVVSELVNISSEFVCQYLVTNINPMVAMADWLLEQADPMGFGIERSCELKSADETKTRIKYVNHDLFVEEIIEHLRDGLQPKALAMTWNGDVDFTLTDELRLRGITFSVDPDGDDSFEANVVLMAGSMQNLITDLTQALGDEFVQQK